MSPTGADQARIVHEVYYGLPATSANLIAQALLEMRREGPIAWTRVTLANAELEMLRPLLREAWRLIAPKTLVAAESGKAPKRKPAKRKR